MQMMGAMVGRRIKDLNEAERYRQDEAIGTHPN